MTDTPTDEFSDTFARLAAELESKPAPAAPATYKVWHREGEDVAASPPTPAPEPLAAEATPAPQEPAEPAVAEPVATEAPKPEGQPAPAPAPAKPEISDEELLKRFAGLVRQPPPEAPKAPEHPAPLPVPPMFTDDEAKFLSAYEKDWPDVARAEAMRRRADLQSVVGYVFQEIAKEFGPVIQGYRHLAERQQVQDLRSTAPDYDNIRDQVVTWVDQQPAFMRAAMQQVVSQGTFEEVSSLINMWRQSTGTTATGGQPAPAAVAPAPKSVQISEATRKAAAALAPVGGKRSNVTRGQPEGFDDTWDEILKAG